ncbi:MAG: DUF3592 domain-containing protein [Myxococcota bacterium]|nr:DUF3592 domain-containing protein [Myxococcota bacterium]
MAQDPSSQRFFIRMMAVCGLLALGGGAYQHQKSSKLEAEGVETTGTWTQVETGRQFRGPGDYKYTLDADYVFQTQDGESVTGSLHRQSDKRPLTAEFSQGDSFTVRYLPSDPSVHERGTGRSGLQAWLWLGVGVLCLGASGGTLLKERLKR